MGSDFQPSIPDAKKSFLNHTKSARDNRQREKDNWEAVVRIQVSVLLQMLLLRQLYHCLPQNSAVVCLSGTTVVLTLSHSDDLHSSLLLRNIEINILNADYSFA
jgi:hypothetical protein